MEYRNAQSYQIQPSARMSLPEVIAAAYRAGGLEPPSDGAALLTRLKAEPNAHQVALDLAAESVTITDAEAWIEQALARIQRAQAADLLLRSVAGHREYAMRENGAELIRQATADLVKPFRSAAARLTKAAAGLPAVEDPLSLEAAVDHDATAARRTALECASIMGRLGSVLGTVPTGDVHPSLRDLLHVVDVPAVPLAHINRMNRETINPDEARDRVRLLAEHAEREGVDRALVGVARGEYGEDVTLSLATDRAELRERIERARIAVSALVADDTRNARTGARKPVVTL